MKPLYKQPRRMRRGLREGLGLAVRDLSHDRRTSLVLIFTVAAIIAPLLLLFGLKNGIVQTLIETLQQNPRNLEVVVYGNTRLEREWFDAYAQRPEVGFIIPKTRTISATIDLVNSTGAVKEAVELVPTAAGDPLLPPELAVPQRATELLVTETLADKLELTPGDAVTGLVRRITDGRTENVLLTLSVSGLIPEARVPSDAAFVHLDLLVASEEFRDGLREVLSNEVLSGEAASGGIAAARNHFANARVFATDIYNVEPLAEAMRADGIEIRTRADDIRATLNLIALLTFIFGVIVVVGVVGGVLALGGALWVNVDRKRRNIALLRLYGFGNSTVVLVPLAQSLAIAAGGLLMAYGGYLAGASVFNNVIGANLPAGGYVCRFGIHDLLNAAAITLGIALIAASAAGYRASRIDAAECLRET